MTTFEYLAILGRQPELGLVELEARLGVEAVEPLGGSAALLSVAVDLDRFGGLVKLGRVLYDGPVTDLAALPVDEAALLSVGGGKRSFGLSVYGARMTLGVVKAAGLSLKKRLRAVEPAGSVRLVAPIIGTTMSAAQLRHNRVLEDGFELLVVVAGGRMVVARTQVVQDIDWYARRDYGRPERSAKVGMLPPKLAQVLVNTTRAEAVVDPFCGSGVVLAEALLLGRRVVGSDVAAEMVAAARANLTWLAVQSEAPTSLPAWQVAEADARTVQLPAGCAVVTEGYLGAPLTNSPTPDRLAVLRRELLVLYRDCLANWGRQLSAGAEVSLCVPAWRVGKRWQYLGLVDELAKLGYTQKVFKHVITPLLYARPDQVVGRQLLFLRKG